MHIRDPLHGSIHFNPSELSVLDTKEYQRLRFIKQLGFAEYSFPGATHNRYLHSLGVCYLAGEVFDRIFPPNASNNSHDPHAPNTFSTKEIRERLRQTCRLAALTPDLGHGPLSHVTEEAMPLLTELQMENAYQCSKAPVSSRHKKRNAPKNTQKPPSSPSDSPSSPSPSDSPSPSSPSSRRAHHEDYTIKFLLQSPLTAQLRKHFSDIPPSAIASLISPKVPWDPDFFKDKGINYQPILHQIISSELDVDRMDYLRRDSYFCGTNYGLIDTDWIQSNLTSYRKEDQVHLALNRKAIYTFDDFLLSRHHMHLMVYFHHKSVIYEEMLLRHLQSFQPSFSLPTNIEEYTRFTDHTLMKYLMESEEFWAKRIVERRPFQLLIERHLNKSPQELSELGYILEKEGIPYIHISSESNLSRYNASNEKKKSTYPIYILDTQSKHDPQVMPIEKCTEIFAKYQGARTIERIYIPEEKKKVSQQILKKFTT